MPALGLSGQLSLPLLCDGHVGGMVALTVRLLSFDDVAKVPERQAIESINFGLSGAVGKPPVPVNALPSLLRPLKLEGHDGLVTCCAVFPHGELIITGSSDRTGAIWSSDGVRLAVLRGHSSALTSCAVLLSEVQVVTTSETEGMIWSRAGQPLKVFCGTRSCVVSPSDEWIVAPIDGNDAAIFSIGGTQRVTLHGHTGRVAACSVFPCSTRLLTVSRGLEAILWSVEGNQLRVLHGHTASITCCSMFPFGERVVTASEDQTGIIWSSAGTGWEFGKKLAVLRGHGGRVLSCIVVLSGRGVVTTSEDSTGILWSETGECLVVLKGHTDCVHACAVFPSGELVLTVSRDKRGIIWSLTTGTLGQQVSQLCGHSGNILACAMFPCSDQALTVSEDWTGTIWDSRGYGSQPAQTCEGGTSLARVGGHVAELARTLQGLASLGSVRRDPIVEGRPVVAANRHISPPRSRWGTLLNNPGGTSSGAIDEEARRRQMDSRQAVAVQSSVDWVRL